MGYVKVAYRNIFDKLDNESELPKGWDEFVKKHAIPHNLIIKSSKNKCHCTNCNNDFISKKKINEEARCPNCHNKYLIKRSNLKYYEFEDYLSILDRVNDIFVVRYFELKTVIDALHEKHHSVVEFAREIPNNQWYREVFVNERVSKNQCHIEIYHNVSWYYNEKKWREYTRHYSLIDYSIVFPNNIKKLLKDTEYKYSRIWDIAKHSTYINLPKFISNKHDIQKTELLSKMKLYNLALRAEEFISRGSFQEIFGVPKDYYTFMRRNNITYKQLKILRLLKEKNMKSIKYLERYINYSESTEDLEKISKYISLNRFIKYSKMHCGKIRTYLYKDYLRFASALGFDLKNNRYAFPKNLEEEHDRLSKEYKILEQELIDKEIKQRAEKLKEKTYKDKKFIVFPARSFNDLIDEGKQQNNCVRTYAEDYAEGECDIYFMRNVKNKSKSLVTIEVQDNEIVQSRIKNNKSPTEEQKNFLDIWQENVLKGAA